MSSRSSAAICGALIALAVSVTVARSEAVHSSAVVNEASGDAIVGAASTYNPFRPGWRVASSPLVFEAMPPPAARRRPAQFALPSVLNVEKRPAECPLLADIVAKVFLG